jgi:hypothetical protein
LEAIGRVGVDLYAETFGKPNVAGSAAIRARIAEAAGKRAGLNRTSGVSGRKSLM